MLITQQGKILRIAARDIRMIGRATQGVRLIDIEGDDRAVSIARIAEQDADPDAAECGMEAERRAEAVSDNLGSGEPGNDEPGNDEPGNGGSGGGEPGGGEPGGGEDPSGA